MLTEKDYCDYDICVALRELGYYDPIQSNTHLTIHLYDAQKWLREKKNIHVQVIVYSYTHLWYYTSICHNKIPITLKVGDTVKMFNSYEEALLEGIKEAIKILKDERVN